MYAQKNKKNEIYQGVTFSFLNGSKDTTWYT